MKLSLGVSDLYKCYPLDMGNDSKRYMTGIATDVIHCFAHIV